MDMDILLSLQDFRNGGGSFLSEFLSKMTFLGELSTVLVIMAIIYWCVHKELGTFLLMGWSGNRLVNGMLKVTACAYRPWIRDSRIVPYGNSITTATGYSFPSGHTMNAATVFGGGIVWKNSSKLLRVFLGLIVLLVAFSRIYLGVHTPQDVLVGAIAGILVMWLVSLMFKWLEKNQKKDWLIVIIGIVLAVSVAVYAGVKSYPADYDSEGKLIVDGAKMANDTFKGVGWCCAFLIGWILERRFVNFSTDITIKRRLTRCVIGLFSYYVVSLIFVPLIKDNISGAVGTICYSFLQMFYIAFIFPWFISVYEKIAAKNKKGKIDLGSDSTKKGKVKKRS